MENRLGDVQQQLQSSINTPWCKTLSDEINRLSSCLSNFLPIYRTRLTRDQLLSSIKLIQELNITSNNDLYRRALTNYLLLVAIHTHKLVCELLLEYNYQLKHHLHYWQHEEGNRSSIIDQLKTTFWFDQARDDIRTVEKVKFLNIQEDFLANIVGRLAYTITNLEQQGQIDLDAIMNYTNELYEILFHGTTVNYDSRSSLIDVIELYSQMLNAFDDFQSQWIEKIHLYYRPTHFKRYFPYYICFTVVGLYTIYRVYSSKERIMNYVYSSYDSLKFFVNEHLIVPLQTIYASTFESRSSQDSLEIAQMNYTNSQKILQELLEDYGRRHVDKLAPINNVSVEEFLSTLSERARNEDMNIVMKNYQLELNTPISSALFGDLITGILIQVHKGKVAAEGVVIQIDQLMKQNQINFSLLATIPALLIITFISIATKNVVSNRVLKRRKFDLSTLRLRIIRMLREIEQTLILNSETPALSFNNHQLIVVESENNNNNGDHQTVMTNLTLGHFLTRIYELKYFTNQIKSKRMLSKEFNDDINLLTYTQLSARQKLLIIQQISHSYSFLVHS